LEIIHITGVLGELVGSGRIKLQPGYFDQHGGGVVTFHDACKIQRKGGHIKEPREILNIIAPQSFKELTPNSEQSICCGGGGGVIASPEADEIRMKAFLPKVEQLEKITPNTVVTACSTCRLQFLDGSKYYDLDIDVRGITELVAAALETDTPKGA
jgi:Fe-S oxidoreductase